MALTTSVSLSLPLSLSSNMKHLGAYEGKNQLLNSRGGNKKYNSNNIRKGFSSVTVRCFKGQLTPSPETLECVAKTLVTDNGGVTPSVLEPLPTTDFTVNDFPPDFLFGTSTSAIQSEGSLNVDGRGPGQWDYLVPDGIAADSYNRYKEDVQMLKEMGVDTYRFSISWSRILPGGTVDAGINEKGIEFYNNLINELFDNGITPWASLLHFDLPLALQTKYNGFLCRRNIVEDFKNYADICFKNFGDRVKYWGTVNEPQVFGQHIYKIGLPSSTVQDKVKDPFIATHNLLLAHASAVKHYKQYYQASQKGEIGLALSALWVLPRSSTPENKRAATRAVDFSLGWLLDPLVYGDYPFNMKALVGESLPQFTKEEKELVKDSYDYIGINYYSSRYAYSIPIILNQPYTHYTQFQHVETCPDDEVRNYIGEKVNNEMYICPQYLKEILLCLKDDYKNPKVYVTENGTPDCEEVQDPLKDTPRIEFMKVHLRAILEAIKSDANVKGFFNWSLLDMKELIGEGYETRMGLIHIPYPDRTRIPKDSSKWLKSFLSQRKIK